MILGQNGFSKRFTHPKSVYVHSGCVEYKSPHSTAWRRRWSLRSKWSKQQWIKAQHVLTLCDCSHFFLLTPTGLKKYLHPQQTTFKISMFRVCKKKACKTHSGISCESEILVKSFWNTLILFFNYFFNCFIDISEATLQSSDSVIHLA